ncbi:hypothetical protein V8F20_003854 [Naviculisporaceae sp. PSN 640]
MGGFGPWWKDQEIAVWGALFDSVEQCAGGGGVGRGDLVAGRILARVPVRRVLSLLILLVLAPLAIRLVLASLPVLVALLPLLAPIILALTSGGNINSAPYMVTI